MRVVTFEDRHDCMFCLKLMQQVRWGWHVELGGMRMVPAGMLSGLDAAHHSPTAHHAPAVT